MVHVRRFHEFIIEKLIVISGITSIIFVALIFLLLLKEGVSLFATVPLSEFLTGKHWYPISDPPKFGILPLILGSLLVTGGAMVISIPLGIIGAVYISEIAPEAIREYLKSAIELIAAIPSVVIGFVGIVTIVPLIKTWFNLPTGLTALTGSVVLAFMSLPLIVSLSEDALRSVPQSYREASLALGATRWQTIYRVVVPAAISGIVASVMLGIGRAIGETMAVMMVTGNAAVIPHSFLKPVRTLTATIAAEMGETVRQSEHYYALFAIGLVLFIIVFCINFSASFFIKRINK
ncbi:MAG: phosphate ABC transporter permease subunit PstC [bacterium]|nr:phosphate ABC transporter permease subunit PstC [bacterium]